MARFFILFCLVVNFSYSDELKLGVEPIIDPTLMAKELVPVLDFANQTLPTRYVFSYSLKEVVGQIRRGEINAIYASSSYFYLLKKLGFVPVLKSRQSLNQVIIHNPDENNDPISKLYYVKNDLSSMFRIRHMDLSGVKLAPTMTSEVAIFSVLKDSRAKAMIMQDELGLLDSGIRNKLVITDKQAIGSVYLMVEGTMAKSLDTWWNNLAQFHTTFKDPNGRYNYLNIYDFERYEGEDSTWQDRLDEYNEFIELILQELEDPMP